MQNDEQKGWKAGAVLAAGAGITAVLAAKKQGNMEMQKRQTGLFAGSRSDYRNTELGKHDKNSKGSTTETIGVRPPEKPAGIEEKSAYLVKRSCVPWQRPASLSVMRRCRERTSTF